MSYTPTVIPNSEDYIVADTLFGSIERTVMSKDFKGGRIRNLFGGTELDLSQSELKGAAVLDISQAFGQTTITIPGDWRVVTDLSQVMAVVEDYRNDIYKTKNSEKVLILKGTSFCANVEIQNY
jgi:predicted membrane protein